MDFNRPGNSDISKHDVDRRELVHFSKPDLCNCRIA